MEFGSGNSQHVDGRDLRYVKYVNKPEQYYVKSGTIEAYLSEERKRQNLENMKHFFSKYMRLYNSGAVGRTPGGGGVIAR